MAKPARTVGVDTGGTFTDLVSLEAGKLRLEKVPSTPQAPERAILDGLAQLGAAADAGKLHVVHGTTVALNALLTGRIARTALVTNAGFADLIEIGRQDRPELYALHPQKTAPLVARELRFEIEQRSWPDPADPHGRCVEVRAPTRAELARLRRELALARPEAIAVCLLHSYADPRPEERVAKALASLGAPITTSAGLLREHREFERFSTAVVNAALTPIVRGYLQRLEGALGGAKLSLLRSSGGRISAARAAQEPVRVLLSGPAGGVIGAARAAREAGFDRMVGLDIGGTSADVAFRRARGRAGEPVRASVVAGHPIGVPALDIHTIGCGGGSLLHVDRGGVLRVGPQSAGADPGPVAYGRGEVPTLTDAHVLLGRIAPGKFLGGRLALDVDAVERAFEKLARRLGVEPREAALAALDVANAAMRRALGVMTMQRGEDPLHTPLVAFGGAGGLHAADLARSMEMPCAIVPFGPGVLSALGMATADAVAERSRSVLERFEQVDLRELETQLVQLERSAREELLEDVEGRTALEFERFYELRYEGQSFELRLAPSPSRAATVRAFHRKHAALYGYALEGSEVELVNVAVRATARSGVKRLAGSPGRATSAPPSSRRVWFADSGGAPRAARASVQRREALRVGQLVTGPAVLEEFSGATVVPPGWSARCVRGGHLVLTANGPAARGERRTARFSPA
jgi:N-methylhydantoinase A